MNEYPKWQRYAEALAAERMSEGRCPECGELPDLHSGTGLGRCSLTDMGVAGRIWQYQQDRVGEA